jgi:diguanylate cyclase (GGDEF)-like protein
MPPLQIAMLSYAITIILNCSFAAVFFYFNPIKKEQNLATTINYFMLVFVTTAFAYLIFLGEIWSNKTLAIVASNTLFTIGFYSIRYAFLWRSNIQQHLYQNKFFYIHTIIFVFIQTYFFHLKTDSVNYRIIFGLFNYTVILISCLPIIKKQPGNATYGEKVSFIAIMLAILLLSSALVIHLFNLDIFVYQTALMVVQAIIVLLFLGAFQTLLLSDISDLHYQNSITDQLTSLYNRRFFIEQANWHLKSAKRYDFPISLIMCDIDYFKRVNDRYGHDVGDKVLQKFSELLKSIMRENDILSRYGGEEFAILLPQTSPQDAAKLAERMRAATEKMTISLAQHKVTFTASFGIVSMHTKINLNDSLKAADNALYKAKQQGRNQVYLSQLTAQPHLN